ncbi:hypothetical protein [Streptomyces nigra]|uniref:hypothetical protein n=1 Tax=Streptomyces nigra TaxID=1827580 RepID=UPI0035DCB4C3
MAHSPRIDGADTAASEDRTHQAPQPSAAVHETARTVVHGIEGTGVDRPYVELRGAATYTMGDLNQRTADVIGEINKSGRPALITKYGRIVAAITPLEGARIESLLISSPEFAQRIAEVDEE